MSYLLFEASDAFTKSPRSHIWAIGNSTSVIFECQHPTADVIGWKVNGMSLGDIGNDDFQVSSKRRNGSAINYLTIHNLTAAYNHTKVECVAIFVDDSQQEVSSAAILLLQGYYKFVKLIITRCQRRSFL